MGDPRKTFICKKCGTKINDKYRQWGNQTPCEYCLRKEYEDKQKKPKG